MNDWGIRARVLFLALMPSIMILLTLVGYFTYARIAEVDVLLAQRGVALARQLAPATEFALFAGDRAALDRLASTAAREADVIDVTITDAQAHVLAHSGRQDSSDLPGAIRFAQPVMATRLDPADFPEQARADSAQAKIGEVTVTLSRSAADARQRELLMVGLALGLAFVLVAIVLALVIGNSVVRPIRRLADAMAELSRGNRVTPLQVEGGGEFRTLSERLQSDGRPLAGGRARIAAPDRRSDECARRPKGQGRAGDERQVTIHRCSESRSSPAFARHSSFHRHAGAPRPRAGARRPRPRSGTIRCVDGQAFRFAPRYLEAR
jgi:HAMP domain-containing protein